MMTWTDERIEALGKMWEAGQTASQIAEALGGVSRNAVIGKAHRLGLQARPSPVKSSEAAASAPDPEPVADVELEAAPIVAAEPLAEPEPAPEAATLADEQDAASVEANDGSDVEEQEDALAAPPVPAAPPAPILRSVGPGGFVRQSPGEQQPPIAPAPPRRLVPAKPSADIAGKTGLLDLNDKICKWPLGHPGEPDFHFCGDRVNPGFPYCIRHCGHAYQAQLPRRDRRSPPPLPFGGPRVR